MLDIATIGQIVRDERKELGLRQDELAAASGVGLCFIVELERGKTLVTIVMEIDKVFDGAEIVFNRKGGREPQSLHGSYDVQSAHSAAAPSGSSWKKGVDIKFPHRM